MHEYTWVMMGRHCIFGFNLPNYILYFEVRSKVDHKERKTDVDEKEYFYAKKDNKKIIEKLNT